MSLILTDVSSYKNGDKKNINKKQKNILEGNLREKDTQDYIQSCLSHNKKENSTELITYLSEKRCIRSFNKRYLNQLYILPTLFSLDRKQYLLDEKCELNILALLDRAKLPQMPQDMLWEIWWFISTSVKQTFIDLRAHYLSVTYVESIDRTFRYHTNKINDMLDAIPIDKLIKFIRFGSPAKYFKLTIYGKQHGVSLYQRIELNTCRGNSPPSYYEYNVRFGIKWQIINMIIDFYDCKQLYEMSALINSIIHVHRKYAISSFDPYDIMSNDVSHLIKL